jgi:D-alanine-D-alanine ligase
MREKECCILYNQPLEGALADELDVLDQVRFIENTLIESGISCFRMGITLDFMNELAALAEKRPGFVFNLVESITNKGELCYFIPALLNMHSIPYTGSPLEAMFITTSKLLTSKTLLLSGIDGPGTYKPSQHGMLTPGKRYIVKPVWEDGSLGITGDSVFNCEPGYEARIAGLTDTHWLIQDFIDGREFNITLLAGEKGVEVMPPAEIVFRNYDKNKARIVDFSAKWDKESFEYRNTVREFPGNDLDSPLKERIESAAIKCWEVFGLRGYARIDMRIGPDDHPYVIEVNANPCLSPDSGVVAATIEAGLPFSEVLERIIKDLNR